MADPKEYNYFEEQTKHFASAIGSSTPIESARALYQYAREATPDAVFQKYKKHVLPFEPVIREGWNAKIKEFVDDWISVNDPLRVMHHLC